MTFYEKLKNFINSFRWPRLLDFFIKLDAKDPTAPTLEEALKDAPPASQNWVRLGLDKISRIGMPTWSLFVIAIAVPAIIYGKDAIIFLFENIVALGILAIFAIPLYFIYKSFVK